VGVFAQSLKKVQSTIYHAFASIFGEYSPKITDISLIYHHFVFKEGPIDP
jgi:hypothetical protein